MCHAPSNRTEKTPHLLIVALKYENSVHLNHLTSFVASDIFPRPSIHFFGWIAYPFLFFCDNLSDTRLFGQHWRSAAQSSAAIWALENYFAICHFLRRPFFPDFCPFSGFKFSDTGVFSQCQNHILYQFCLVTRFLRKTFLYGSKSFPTVSIALKIALWKLLPEKLILIAKAPLSLDLSFDRHSWASILKCGRVSGFILPFSHQSKAFLFIRQTCHQEKISIMFSVDKSLRKIEWVNVFWRAAAKRFSEKIYFTDSRSIAVWNKTT